MFHLSYSIVALMHSPSCYYWKAGKSSFLQLETVAQSFALFEIVPCSSFSRPLLEGGLDRGPRLTSESV